MPQASLIEASLPAPHEIAAAALAQRALSAYVCTDHETQRIEIVDATSTAHAIDVPTAALGLLVDILSELASGNAVKVVPIHAELTTQEAADMLNVSRPHLVKLLEAGDLPFHRTGKHRRVRFADLMDYKAQRDRAAQEATQELADQAQELGMGYE